jgi:very-short-patch-repair endonuclease
MTAPTGRYNIDYAIELYLAGKSRSEIRAASGITPSVLCRERARRGIPTLSAVRVPIDEIVAAYRAGESELSLSNRFGIARSGIRPRLLAAGVEIRDASEAQKVRVQRMTPEERQAQTRAAHDAVRGTKQSIEYLLKRAQSRESKGLCDSPGELFLLGELAARGLTAIPQKAIGKYNVDFAVAPIAVEVLGGGWHMQKRHHAVRTPAILNTGWHLLFIWNHEGSSALTAGAADYVVTFLEQVRRDPPAVGEYRVITGSGEFLAAGRADDGQFPLVAPPRGR